MSLQPNMKQIFSLFSSPAHWFWWERVEIFAVIHLTDTRHLCGCKHFVIVICLYEDRLVPNFVLTCSPSSWSRDKNLFSKSNCSPALHWQQRGFNADLMLVQSWPVTPHIHICHKTQGCCLDPLQPGDLHRHWHTDKQLNKSPSGWSSNRWGGFSSQQNSTGHILYCLCLHQWRCWYTYTPS